MTVDGPRWACDTSVAIPAVDPTHEAHEMCRREVLARRPVLAGHAAIEAYAVLTRLPVPLRLTATAARQVLDQAFGEPCWPGRAEAMALLDDLARTEIVGGACFDALVAAAAMSDERTLMTRDRRAERTYRVLGAPYDLVA